MSNDDLYKLSANMSLPIPTPEVDPGPDYALNLNASLTLIDSHNHSSGQGVSINPDGLDINAELPFGNNDATELRTVRLQAQSSVSAVFPDLLCIYAVGNDLYYNDGAGNEIRITQSGSVAGAAGTITGLPSGTASASYSSGTGKFIFQSASLIGADIDGASIIIREKVTSGKGVTLSAPAGLAADYEMLMPAALPIAQKFLSLDSSGNIAANWAVDNSSLEINSNSLRVKAGGITKPMLAPLGQQISTSSDGFVTGSTAYIDVTNLSVNITVTGRPIKLELIPDATGSTSFVSVEANSTIYAPAMDLAYLIDSSVILEQHLEMFPGSGIGGGGLMAVPGNSFSTTLIGVAAGTYNFKVQVRITGGTTNQYLIRVRNLILLAYEL